MWTRHGVEIFLRKKMFLSLQKGKIPSTRFDLAKIWCVGALRHTEKAPIFSLSKCFFFKSSKEQKRFCLFESFNVIVLWIFKKFHLKKNSIENIPMYGEITACFLFLLNRILAKGQVLIDEAGLQLVCFEIWVRASKSVKN